MARGRRGAELERWLDEQVAAGRLTLAQARDYLPTYTLPADGRLLCVETYNDPAHEDADDDSDEDVDEDCRAADAGL